MAAQRGRGRAEAHRWQGDGNTTVANTFCKRLLLSFAVQLLFAFDKG